MLCSVLSRERLVLGEWMSEFQTFGEWLKSHRESERYSMRALGTAIGRSHTYIQKLEEDPSLPEEMSPRPPLDIVNKIAHTLEASLIEAKRLAGYPIEGEITYETAPNVVTLLERYNNSDEDGRRLIEDTAELAAERAALRASRAGAIGGRAGD